MNILEDVAIVVAARNEEDNIRDCIESLQVASKNKAEIWVVDDASTDRTAEILKSFKDKIHLFKGEGKGPGRARNQAVNKITKKWVAFTDADCVVAPDWLEKLSEAIQNYSSVGGPQAISKKAKK